jgi:cell division protein FtsI/penicillin-binding protein 2
LSLRLTSETLSHWYSVFGFGQSTAVNGMPAGHVTVGSDIRRKALAALGEADIVATPAEVLQAYSAVASRGEFRILGSGHEQRKDWPSSRRIELRSQTWGALIDGLVGCVQFGTCQEAAVAGVRVAGKTGTATALDGSGVTHAWFAGFAPAENPEIAIVVFLDRGTGAHSAAPLAGAILREYGGNS